MKKGTIVVRTNDLKNPEESAKKGYMFAIIKDSSFAYYADTRYIGMSNFRLATQEEIEAFNKGITNINKMKNTINNFCVFINKDKEKLQKYIELCDKYNIKVNYTWEGSANYYGINRNNEVCVSNSSFGNVFNMETFEEYLSSNFNLGKNTLLYPSTFYIDKISSSEIEEYKIFCIKYGIPYEEKWIGGGNGYGLKDGIKICSSKRREPQFQTFDEFKEYILTINKQEKNEKTTIITTDRHREISGNSISSSRVRQITTQSRPIGNTIFGKCLQTKNSSAKIGGSVITI